MIRCMECESVQHLRITQSDVDYDYHDEPQQIDERYVCVGCGNRGRYWFIAGSESVSGCVEVIDRGVVDH